MNQGVMWCHEEEPVACGQQVGQVRGRWSEPGDTASSPVIGPKTLETAEEPCIGLTENGATSVINKLLHAEICLRLTIKKI